jgi:hypothetical protein
MQSGAFLSAQSFSPSIQTICNSFASTNFIAISTPHNQAISITIFVAYHVFGYTSLGTRG